ncbi:sensor histidine kinase [Mangrovibacterium sp.]|uniref:sensor histidine kinase n=1 Tax=Mangrovibacterium sp. TaxID=1961364 RepID=UPI003564E212
MKSALKITLIYFLISFFWILFSDQFIRSVTDQAEIITQLQTYKGWFFVISTSLFLYFLVRNEIKKKLQLLNELKKAKEKAEESDRFKSTFLSNMSHEIRTPLNGIVGFSQMLFEGDDDEANRQMYIEQVNKNSDILLKIIDNVLELSRIQENMILPDFNQLNIADLLIEIERNFLSKKALLEEKGLEFFVAHNPEFEGLFIRTDHLRLNQILYNLLDNAVKYTTAGQITLGIELEPQHLRIFVADTGIGIPEDQLPLIFERFKRAHENDAGISGFGLGLSISKGLAQALNATIEVDSQPGKGSKFSVRLPLEA